MKNTASAAPIYQDLTTEELVAHALRAGEGVLSKNGALNVATGKRTGRSPKDRFIVKDTVTENTVDWGSVNQPISPDKFHALWERARHYIQDRPHYVSHLQVGSDERYFLPVRVVTELAWHQLFARHLFIRPEGNYANGKAPWEIVSTPGLATEPARDGVNSEGAVIINLSERKVLLVGMLYAGEMKKAMFSVMNYWLPEDDVLPMHCAANMSKDKKVALFFGLSGTGKTTLSADPERLLIGDDEHGWGRDVVFNIEGGCYAKCDSLSPEREPVIFKAIRDGAVMENVVLKSNGEPDYNDTRLTQNTRAAYPRDYIEELVPENKGGVPNAVIFLTCDLYGVLPPVALLTKEQAAYYFLSGYTALVGSTEVGSTAGIKPTFSTCFGAPFFPRPATVYAELLMKRLAEDNCPVYLVNTGWSGGAYGEGGERFSIPTTRAVVRAILNDELRHQKLETLPGFNLKIPTHLNGVDAKLLDPRKLWQDQAALQKQTENLMQKFSENFKKFKVSAQIQQAGPH